MNKFGWFATALVFGLALLIFSVSVFNDSQASKVIAQGHARSMVIVAQGQSRLDSAQATSILLSAALPWGIMGIVALYGFIFLGMVVSLMIYFKSNRQPPMLIERQIIFLPDPSLSRHEIWQALSDNSTQNFIRLESNNDLNRRV